MKIAVYVKEHFDSLKVGMPNTDLIRPMADPPPEDLSGVQLFLPFDETEELAPKSGLLKGVKDFCAKFLK